LPIPQSGLGITLPLTRGLPFPYVCNVNVSQQRWIQSCWPSWRTCTFAQRRRPPVRPFSKQLNTKRPKSDSPAVATQQLSGALLREFLETRRDNPCSYGVPTMLLPSVALERKRRPARGFGCRKPNRILYRGTRLGGRAFLNDRGSCANGEVATGAGGPISSWKTAP